MTRLRAQIPRSASRLLFVCRPRAGRERCPEFRSWETSGDRKYDAHSHPQPSTYRSLDRLLNDVERKIIESGRPNPSLAVLSFGLLQLRCSTTVRCWEPPTSIAAAPAQPWPACGTWPGRSHSAEPGLQCGAAPRHVSVRSTHTSSAHFPGSGEFDCKRFLSFCFPPAVSLDFSRLSVVAGSIGEYLLPSQICSSPQPVWG